MIFFYSKAFEELEDLLSRNNICIAVKEKLVKDSGVAEEIAYDNIIQKMLTKPRARGKQQRLIRPNKMFIRMFYFSIDNLFEHVYLLFQLHFNKIFYL